MTLYDLLDVKMFADGADEATMLEMANLPYIQGLTTNPTLMKKAGVSDYRQFAKSILSVIRDKPVSFEVFSDTHSEMERQATEIASWGDNVYVKIPITNTKAESSLSTVKRLVSKGVKVNVTAIMTVEQVANVVGVLDSEVPSYVSVFAGRIADTGIDPVPIMSRCVGLLDSNKTAELIWASPRELLNVFQANKVGCHVITATSDILRKLKLVGKDLDEFSIETVMMFHEDAKEAGYTL